MMLMRVDKVAVIIGALFLLLFIFIISAFIISARRLMQRSKTLENFAKEKGFSYNKSADFPAFLRDGNFALFSKGHRSTSKVKNLLHGHINDVDVLIFD